jgi:hypothetical protein
MINPDDSLHAALQEARQILGREEFATRVGLPLPVKNRSRKAPKS